MTQDLDLVPDPDRVRAEDTGVHGGVRAPVKTGEV
jgi:hypothetical protein